MTRREIQREAGAVDGAALRARNVARKPLVVAAAFRESVRIVARFRPLKPTDTSTSVESISRRESGAMPVQRQNPRCLATDRAAALSLLENNARPAVSEPLSSGRLIDVPRAAVSSQYTSSLLLFILFRSRRILFYGVWKS